MRGVHLVMLLLGWFFVYVAANPVPLLIKTDDVALHVHERRSPRGSRSNSPARNQSPQPNTGPQVGAAQRDEAARGRSLSQVGPNAPLLGLDLPPMQPQSPRMSEAGGSPSTGRAASLERAESLAPFALDPEARGITRTRESSSTGSTTSGKTSRPPTKKMKADDEDRILTPDGDVAPPSTPPRITVGQQDRLKDELEKARAPNKILAAGAAARQGLDRPRDPNHRDKPDPVISAENGYEQTVVQGKGPMYRQGSVLFETHRTINPGASFIAENLKRIVISNPGGDGIFQGGYETSTNNLHISNMQKGEDKRLGVKNEEMHMSEMIYSVIKEGTKDQADGVRAIRTITEADIQSSDGRLALSKAFEITPDSNIRQQYFEDGLGDIINGMSPKKNIYTSTLDRYSQNPIEQKAFDTILGSKSVRFTERMFNDYREKFGDKKISKFYSIRGVNDDSRAAALDPNDGWWALVMEADDRPNPNYRPNDNTPIYGADDFGEEGKKSPDSPLNEANYRYEGADDPVEL